MIRPSISADTREVDPNYFVLPADTHVDGDPERISWGINMAENLEEVIQRDRGLTVPVLVAPRDFNNSSCAAIDSVTPVR